MNDYLNERIGERIGENSPCGLLTSFGYVQARLVDVSCSGARVRCPVRLAAGSSVGIALRTGSSVACIVVRHDAFGTTGVRFLSPRDAMTVLAAAGVRPLNDFGLQEQRDYAEYIGNVSTIREITARDSQRFNQGP